MSDIRCEVSREIVGRLLDPFVDALGDFVRRYFHALTFFQFLMLVVLSVQIACMPVIIFSRSMAWLGGHAEWAALAQLTYETLGSFSMVQVCFVFPAYLIEWHELRRRSRCSKQSPKHMA